MIRNFLFLVTTSIGLLLGCATPEVAITETSPAPEPPRQVIAEPQVAVPALVPKSNEGYSGSSALPIVPVPEVAKVTADQLLQEGTVLYEKGDFRGAIRKLVTARDTADDGSIVKKQSLRQLAFSYCVSNQRVLCRQQFASLLAIEPSFQLTRGEAGHPLWGPAFQEAKAAMSATVNKKK
jgi:hypothetical protein